MCYGEEILTGNFLQLHISLAQAVRSVLGLHVYGIRLNSYASYSFRVAISFIVQ